MDNVSIVMNNWTFRLINDTTMALALWLYGPMAYRNQVMIEGEYNKDLDHRVLQLIFQVVVEFLSV